VDGWADTIIAVASVAAVFFAVMGFRGLIEGIQKFSGRCDECHRATLLPPPISHRCWHCRHRSLFSLPGQAAHGELGVESDTVG
jgi:hypothetical protein